MKNMKRSLWTSLFLMLAVATFAQPRLSSNKEKHDFGQIQWKQPVTVEYTITNTGDKPLVMSNVSTSCACSVADWTKDPIMPGEKGFVRATFDAQALGHFEKEIEIYSNSQPNLVYLSFVGEVVPELSGEALDQSNYYAIGSIRIDRSEFDFPDVHKGENPSITFNVINLSNHPYEPVLMHLPPYLSMTKQPNVILKGKHGTVTLTLDSKKLTDYGLTQSSVYLTRFAGDKVSEENEIPVSAILLPDFSNLTATEKKNAPVVQLSETVIDLSAALAASSKAKHNVMVTNAGRSSLQISKLQVFNPAVGVKLKKSVLQPGETVKMEITVHKRNIDKKKHKLRILMITNDPVHPKMIINLKR